MTHQRQSAPWTAHAPWDHSADTQTKGPGQLTHRPRGSKSCPHALTCNLPVGLAKCALGVIHAPVSCPRLKANLPVLPTHKRRLYRLQQPHNKQHQTNQRLVNFASVPHCGRVRGQKASAQQPNMTLTIKDSDIPLAACAAPAPPTHS